MQKKTGGLCKLWHIQRCCHPPPQKKEKKLSTFHQEASGAQERKAVLWHMEDTIIGPWSCACPHTLPDRGRLAGPTAPPPTPAHQFQQCVAICSSLDWRDMCPYKSFTHHFAKKYLKLHKNTWWNGCKTPYQHYVVTLRWCDSIDRSSTLTLATTSELKHPTYINLTLFLYVECERKFPQQTSRVIIAGQLALRNETTWKNWNKRARHLLRECIGYFFFNLKISLKYTLCSFVKLHLLLKHTISVHSD